MTAYVQWVSAIAAAAVACVGGYLDIKIRKIPNKYTFPSMLIGVVLNLLIGGLSGVVSSLSGLLLGFSFFFLFAIGALKAGDVKLYMAVGAVGGLRMNLYTMIFSILIGGAVALVLTLAHKSGRKTLHNLWNYLVNMILTRRFYMYQAEEESSYFSFGCCIGAGAVMALIRTMR